MKKSDAISLLGGTVSDAAKSIGINPQAVTQWPDELTPRIADRVLAAVARSRPEEWACIWRALDEAERQLVADRPPQGTA